jgi:Ca-activated chloride channel family protein
MMLRNKKLMTLLLLSFMGVLLLATACSPSNAEKLNEEGNEAFAQQAFQEALVAYQTAQIEEPELAEPYYNAANALYRQGAYADALKQMEMALSFAAEETLAQASFYNLGNSSYNQQDLQAAVDSYTQALLLNPDDQDAKYNLELALQQLQQQQQNQEQQQQDEQQQEQQEQEQQQEESQNGKSQEEEQQDQSGEGEEQQDQEGQQEEQEADSQEGQESEEGQEAQEEQQDEGQQGEGEQDEEQQQGQGQPQEGQPDENQEGQLNELPAPGQRMTEEQAEQLLAAIARDGQTLQEKLGQIFAAPWTPPVQDW